MINLLNVFLFFWLLYWAIISGRQIAIGQFNSILFVIITHFIFCGIPSLLDVIIGIPDYTKYPGFWYGARDPMTSLVYAVYVASCPPVWWVTGKYPSIERITVGKSTVRLPFKHIQCICVSLMILPVLIAAMSPYRDLYLSYAGIVLLSASEDANKWHTLIDIAIKVGIFAAGMFIFYSREIDVFKVIFLLIILFIFIWINGKRHTVAYIGAMVLFLSWYRGSLKGKELLFVSSLLILVLLIFSNIYQNVVRGISVESVGFQSTYENFRIDYGRDDVIKMTIYAELYPKKMQILEYKGQSLLFNLLFFIPRETWQNKPWPYSIYFTSALFNSKYPISLGWGMTTSWLEESIANLGWLGMIVGPLFFSLLCRVGDRYGKGMTRYMTVMIACSFLVVQFSAFAMLFMIWCIFVLYDRRRSTKMRTLSSTSSL